jgi:small subunit ribosomal protein S20
LAHHKDAIKRNKQSIKRNARNRAYRTELRNTLKKVRAAVASGSKDASAALPNAVSVIQHIAAKGVIHRNTAARYVSRLNAAVKALSSK